MDEYNRELPRQEQFDIFLCTRELPDKLTEETAALRQLCAALAGEGYKVFFPSALPRELTDEERAKAVVEALKSCRVMVAAGIGRESLTDILSRGLWGAFLKSGEDARRRFFLCWRDQGEEPLPAPLENMVPFDMSDLRFLTELKAALAQVLPPPRELGTEEISAASGDALPEEAPVGADPGEAAPAEGTPAEPEKKPFPWKWVLLGAAVIALVVWLLFRK